MKTLWQLALTLVIVAWNGHATASTIALQSFSGGTATTAGSDQLYGWQFNLLAPIEVSALGAFDTNSDGFAEAHDVGIYDTATQSLLVSTTLAAGVGGTLSGGFRYTSLAGAVSLPVGQYVIVLTMPDSTADTQFVLANSVVTTAPEIQYLTSAFDAGATLHYPNEAFLGSFAEGLFGPNFQFDSAAAPVPEPASLTLLGLGLAGLGARRWRQRKH